MLGSCLIFSNVITGNGRGGESIYGGFFEGNQPLRACTKVIPQGSCLKMAVKKTCFSPQMKALRSNTIKSTCCLWPTGAKIQMVHSFSCKNHLYSPTKLSSILVNSTPLKICVCFFFSFLNPCCGASEQQNPHHIWMGTSSIIIVYP